MNAAYLLTLSCPNRPGIVARVTAELFRHGGDIKEAHQEVRRRGINASEMWHGAPFPAEARIPGPDPQRTSYRSFFAFADPDGNAWLVQEVTTRHPGR